MVQARRVTLYGALAVALTLLAGQVSDAHVTAHGDRNQQMVDGFNGIRSAAGLGWLGGDPCVQAVAQARANDMAARGYFSHYSPEGTSAFDLLNGFGCAWGQAAEVIERNNLGDEEGGFWLALRDLAGSAPHYWIIVGDYRVVGAAMVQGADGFTYTAGVFVR